MTYHVVDFEEKHQPGIVNLILPIQQLEFNVPITINDCPDLQDISSFYLKGRGNFWVALSADKVVGTIAIVALGNQQAALRKMFVHEAHRGKEKGVAQLLFDSLVSWCKKENVSEIFLGTVDSMHAAHRFYKKNSFQEITNKELPDSFPIMRVDNMYFRLKFNLI